MFEKRNYLNKNIQKYFALLIFLIAALAVTFKPTYTNSPPIRSDGFGYHAWTKAILSGDLSFCGNEELINVGAIQDTPNLETNRCGNKYPPGLALLRFPIMAPLAFLNDNVEVASPLENWANQLLSIFFGCLAIIFSIKLCSTFGISEITSNFAALAIVFGTGFFHYATYDSSYTHIYSAGLFSIILFLTLKLIHEKNYQVKDVYLIIPSTFLLLIRPQLVVVLFGLVLYLSKFSNGKKLKFWIDLLLIPVMVTFTVLASYYSWINGKFSLNSYPGENFYFNQPHQFDVLFDLNRGLFIWYPVVFIIALLVLFPIKENFYLFWCTTLPLVVLYGFWHAWNLLADMGHRGFVDISPVFIFLLASELKQKNRFNFLAAFVFAAVLICIGLMLGYWQYRIDFFTIDFKTFLDNTVGKYNVLFAIKENFLIWIRSF